MKLGDPSEAFAYPGSLSSESNPANVTAESSANKKLAIIIRNGKIETAELQIAESLTSSGKLELISENAFSKVFSDRE